MSVSNEKIKNSRIRETRAEIDMMIDTELLTNW